MKQILFILILTIITNAAHANGGVKVLARAVSALSKTPSGTQGVWKMAAEAIKGGQAVVIKDGVMSIAGGPAYQLNAEELKTIQRFSNSAQYSAQMKASGALLGTPGLPKGANTNLIYETQRKANIKKYLAAKERAAAFRNTQYMPIFEFFSAEQAWKYLDELESMYKAAVFQGKPFTPGSPAKHVNTYSLKDKQELIVRLSKDTKNVKYIDNNFAYSSLVNKDTQYLIVGETHRKGHVEHLASMIGELRANAGLNSFSHESLLTHMKPYINNYQKTGNPNEVKTFADAVHGPLKTVVDNVYGKVHGLNIFAMEESRDVFLGMDFKMTIPETENNTFMDVVWEKAAAGGAVHLEESGTALSFRNASWIKNIEENERPGLTLLFMGIGHSSYNNPRALSISDILTMKGKNITVINFVDQLTSPLLKNIANPTRKAVVTVPGEYKNILGADYLIYIPPHLQNIKK